MTRQYQMTGFDTRAVAVPEQVSVAMADIAADMREGLLALAVGAGLQVMQSLMEEDMAACCGPRGRARCGPDRDPAWQRAGVGHPGGPPGAGEATTGPGQRRIR